MKHYTWSLWLCLGACEVRPLSLSVSDVTLAITSVPCLMISIRTTLEFDDKIGLNLSSRGPWGVIAVRNEPGDKKDAGGSTALIFFSQIICLTVVTLNRCCAICSWGISLSQSCDCNRVWWLLLAWPCLAPMHQQVSHSLMPSRRLVGIGQDLYSLSGRTAYRKISSSLEAERFGFRLFQ